VLEAIQLQRGKHVKDDQVRTGSGQQARRCPPVFTQDLLGRKLTNAPERFVLI
jgi:hypothetical protein